MLGILLTFYFISKVDSSKLKRIGLGIISSVVTINFYLFSTYAPMMPMDHYGIVHLGFIGIFFKISEGQYDYPKWLEFFH
jgi:hypothetical protein